MFHGAESDIVWLQQDFNLYVVNLFDTFHASKVLGEPISPIGPDTFFYSPRAFDIFFQISLDIPWLHSFLCTATLTQTNDTNWPTGGYGVSISYFSSLVSLLEFIAFSIGRSPKKCSTTHDQIPTTSSTYTTICDTRSSNKLRRTARKILSGK